MTYVYFTIVFALLVLRFTYRLTARGSEMTYNMAFRIVLLCTRVYGMLIMFQLNTVQPVFL